MIAVIFEYLSASYTFKLVGVLITFGLGAFLLALTALAEAKHGMKKINDLAKFEKNRLETLNRLGDFVYVHGRLMQLSTNFSLKVISFR